MQEAAADVLPPKGKPSPPWFTASEATLLPLIAKRDAALDANHRAPSPSSQQHLRLARSELNKALRRAQSDWVMATCAPINDGIVGSRGSALAWSKVKTLKGGLGPSSRPAQPKMKKKDGSLASSAEENAAVFAEGFKELYGRTATFDPSIIDHVPQRAVMAGLDHAPTDKEIRWAVGRLNCTAPGDSGVHAQLFKALASTDEGFALIRETTLHFFETGEVPTSWETGLLAILPKKGDLSLFGNYRGIMMLEVSYKIQAIILNARLEPIVEALDEKTRDGAATCGLDHESQNGFRGKRGCSDGIFTIRQLIAKRREHGLESWVLFIDLVKAFDRVPRELLWKVLLKYGVPPKIVDLLIALHKSVHVKFEVDGVERMIESIIGVKQGDILGPTLFIFYIAAIMETWRSEHDYDLCVFRSRDDFTLTGRKPTTDGKEFAIADSEYADDTALPFTSRKDAEEQAPKVITHFERWGMEVHAGITDGTKIIKGSKSEILFCAARNLAYTNPSTFDNADFSDVLLPGGRFMPIVSKFPYLGSYVSRNGSDALDVDSRIVAAGKAFGALRACLFSSTHINAQAKAMVFVTLILGILLYGAESWRLTERVKQRLRVFHARCVRGMCRVSRKHTWKHNISTATLEQRLGLDSFDTYFHRRQLRWLGHLARMDYARLPRRMLSSWVPHPRPTGAPHMTYGRNIKKALRDFNIDQRTWFNLAADRSAWRETLRLGHPPGFTATPPTPPLALTRPTRFATIKTNAAIDECNTHTAVISCVSTRRDVGGGFIVRSDKSRLASGHRFKEVQLTDKDMERMCSCTKHSYRGCQRRASRLITDDEGNAHPFCGACLPNHFLHVCLCPCAYCRNIPASPTSNKRKCVRPSTPPTRDFPGA